MAPSQLKQLKASLREKGIVGPQKSKKQKRQSQGADATQQRNKRQAALQQIRDSFNPFEIKAVPRNAKFASMSDRAGPAVLGRPGVTKSEGEKARRQNLLPELQRRKKSGGIVDRRIGEDDASMTPEERALQRFVREKTRRKNGSMFDLEGSDEEESGLTHLGRALDLDGDAGPRDDFDAGSLIGSDDDGQTGEPLLKRRREVDPVAEDDAEEQAEDDEEPARKKSKAEVMKEVMAKSKLHKYERQKAKEDDDDLRAQLDSEMGDMLALLQGVPKKAPKVEEKAPPKDQHINPDRLAMLQGKSREAADKEYDTRLRQMASEQRAAPADRTKTEEEKAKDEVDRLKKLEDSRQRRMRGEEVDSEDSGDEKEKLAQAAAQATQAAGLLDWNGEEEEIRDDAAEFGLSVGQSKADKTTFDDEDDFELDDDLVASGSDIDSDADSISGSEGGEDDDDASEVDDEEDEFVKGILDGDIIPEAKKGTTKAGVAFTYACPTNHDELLGILDGVSSEDVPTIVQRIRALYHPSLSAENKTKLAAFSSALVDHLAYLGKTSGSIALVETLTRHLHSLSRTFPLEIAVAFRGQLQALREHNELNGGVLVILTAIGSIYPTSDHFHQVVTPATTLAARWLGMTNPSTTSDCVRGAYLVQLLLSYQELSKRYIPEALRFTLKALQSPVVTPELISIHLINLSTMAELYRDLTAFIPIFSPAISVLSTIPSAKKTLSNLQILISQSRLSLRPLTLHNHRPRPIRSSIPKFEENFAPGRHYDPDKERSDAAKLRKEYKRERKGALRELRKDASFVAREQLRDQKERDAAYEKKFRRIVAEINSEEGREGKGYEREKERRQRGNKRK